VTTGHPLLLKWPTEATIHWTRAFRLPLLFLLLLHLGSQRSFTLPRDYSQGFLFLVFYTFANVGEGLCPPLLLSVATPPVLATFEARGVVGDVFFTIIILLLGVVTVTQHHLPVIYITLQ
jgi:hypothetical protein